MAPGGIIPGSFIRKQRKATARIARGEITIAGAAASIILAVLGFIHFYWAAGGRAGKTSTVPTRDGRPVIRPTPITTALVAVGLCAMPALVAIRIGWISLSLGAGIERVGLWLVAGLFLLRSIGDFRYVGFFKRERDTRFAKLDSTLYSPLCLLLAILITITAIS